MVPEHKHLSHQDALQDEQKFMSYKFYLQLVIYDAFLVHRQVCGHETA